MNLQEQKLHDRIKKEVKTINKLREKVDFYKKLITEKGKEGYLTKLNYYQGMLDKLLAEIDELAVSRFRARKEFV